MLLVYKVFITNTFYGELSINSLKWWSIIDLQSRRDTQKEKDGKREKCGGKAFNLNWRVHWWEYSSPPAGTPTKYDQERWIEPMQQGQPWSWPCKMAPIGCLCIKAIPAYPLLVRLSPSQVLPPSSSSPFMFNIIQIFI